MLFKYFDIHSHIHGERYDADRAEVLARMRELKMGTITVGTYFESSKAAVALAEKESDVWATIGLHPTDTKADFRTEEWEPLARHTRVVAIGECGLDYFRFEGDTRVEKARQKEIFFKQLELAVRVDKPLMIHCRPSPNTMDAHEDMIKILTEKKNEYGENLRGNIHFFTGTIEVAQKYFELGFTVSFPGVITFAPEYESVIRGAPLSMIHVETDAPYAAPTPHRGKRNEPAYVVEVVKKIAEIKGMGEIEVALALIKNTMHVFRLA